MFNFLTVAVFLPLEMMTKYLYHFSKWIISLSPDLESGEKPPDMLKKLTKPFTKLVSSVDKKVITKIAAAETQAELDALADKRMLKKLFNMGPDDISDVGAGWLILV